MSLQTKLYTLNALSTELGHDRRSLGKWLDDLLPAETAADGTRRWRLKDVLAHLDRRRAIPIAGSDQSLESEMGEWVGHKLLPAVLGSDTFCKVFMGALVEDLRLTKHQALRTYTLLWLAVTVELDHSGVSKTVDLPPLAEQIAKEGIAAVAARWPDSPERVDG